MAKFSVHVDKTTKIRSEYEKLRSADKVKRLHQEQEAKETDEVLRAGQPNRKTAIKEIAKIVGEEKKEKKKQVDEALNKLDMAKRSQESYKSQLAKTLAELLQMLDWIRGWSADVVVTDGRGINIKGRPFATKDGILLIVCTPDGRVMHQGMLCTGEPALDYAGLYNLALQTENTMDKERGLLLTSSQSNGDSGIVGVDGRPIASTQGKSLAESQRAAPSIP